MNASPSHRGTPITGLICAPFTALDAKGDLNLAIVPDYAGCLKENGIIGAFVNGSSGEGLLLTLEERFRAAEAWARECDAAFKLVLHVGATSLREARQLAVHAEGLGAHAISAMAPTFPPLGTVEQLGEYCAEIAAAAPNTPFYYYHIPALSRVDLPMSELLRFAEARIENFAGIKFTSADLHDLARCTRHQGGRYDILAGLDETMLGSLSVANSRGFIGGTFNYCAPLYTGMIAAFEQGDIAKARALQEHSQDLIDILIRYRGNMVAGKQMMKLVGLDLGAGRRPLARMDQETFAAMARDLDRAGFFEVCNTLNGVRPGKVRSLAG